MVRYSLDGRPYPLVLHHRYPRGILLASGMLKTHTTPRFRYSYDEFVDHVKAMRTVRTWEYTSRFGHLGLAQTSWANNARVLEYFSDSYSNQSEAVYKADLFLSIHDYLGRHEAFFSKKDFLDKIQGDLLSVDPALLRAAHHVFTVSALPEKVDPRKLVTLARAYKEATPWC